MIIVAGATNEPAVSTMNRMRISAKELGLSVDARRLPDLGSWEKNVAQKPEFARTMLDHLGEDIALVEVDAVFRSVPLKFTKPDFEEDVALFFAGTGMPSSGTIFLKNTRKARMFLTQWSRLIEIKGGDSFGALVATATKPRFVPIHHLGPEYFWVEKAMRQKYPGAKPVIEFFTEDRG